jgi:hypothetical protein
MGEFVIERVFARIAPSEYLPANGECFRVQKFCVLRDFVNPHMVQVADFLPEFEFVCFGEGIASGSR